MNQNLKFAGLLVGGLLLFGLLWAGIDALSGGRSGRAADIAAHDREMKEAEAADPPRPLVDVIDMVIRKEIADADGRKTHVVDVKVGQIHHGRMGFGDDSRADALMACLETAIPAALEGADHKFKAFSKSQVRERIKKAQDDCLNGLVNPPRKPSPPEPPAGD